MESKPSLTLTLRRLKPNDICIIPFSMFKYSSVRQAASIIGREEGKTFSTHVNWDSNVTHVIRTR